MLGGINGIMVFKHSRVLKLLEMEMRALPFYFASYVQKMLLFRISLGFMILLKGVVLGGIRDIEGL